MLVFAILIGVPLFMVLHKPPSCQNGKQDGGETAIDKGGPCSVLDERTLTPEAVMWARTFQVRQGVSSAAAYIDNPNQTGGVLKAPYKFSLYDAGNVIVAEREGTAFILPGSVTPVFEGQISTGNREAVRAFFEFTGPLVWQKVRDVSRAINITGKQVTDTSTLPRVAAKAQNTSVTGFKDVTFVAVVFDTAGNAFAASETVVSSIPAGKGVDITFTWPTAFTRVVGHVDITPIVPPVATR